MPSLAPEIHIPLGSGLLELVLVFDLYLHLYVHICVCGLLCPPAYAGVTCTPFWEDAPGDTVTDEAGVVG